MADSIGGITVDFLRQGGRRPLFGARLAHTVRHIPGSNKQVVDFGGVQVKRWAGEIRLASITDYNSLDTIYLAYATGTPATTTVVQGGTTYTCYLVDLGDPSLDPVGSKVQCRVELIRAS